jgi:hypothetical protein
MDRLDTSNHKTNAEKGELEEESTSSKVYKNNELDGNILLEQTQLSLQEMDVSEQTSLTQNILGKQAFKILKNAFMCLLILIFVYSSVDMFVLEHSFKKYLKQCNPIDYVLRVYDNSKFESYNETIL